MKRGGEWDVWLSGMMDCDVAVAAAAVRSPNERWVSSLVKDLLDGILTDFIRQINVEVDFEKEVKPYVYLYEDDPLCLRPEKMTSPFFMSEKADQVFEISQLGDTIEERQEKVRTALKVTMQEACQYLGQDEILPSDNAFRPGNFVYAVQFRIFRCMLLKPDNVIWVPDGKGQMMIPIWSHHYDCFKYERIRTGFDRFEFLLGCFHRLLDDIRNFKFPSYTGNPPAAPKKFEEWFDNKGDGVEGRHCAAMKRRYSLAGKLMRLGIRDVKVWWPVHFLCQSKAPTCDLFSDDSNWRWVFSMIANGNYGVHEFHKHIESIRVSMFSRISTEYLTYVEKVVCFRTIPTCVARIEMRWMDSKSDRSFMNETLFFYCVSAILLRDRGRFEETKTIFFKYLIAHFPGDVAIDSKTAGFFAKECLQFGIKFEDGGFVFRDENHRHDFVHACLDSAKLRDLCANVSMSRSWCILINEETKIGRERKCEFVYRRFVRFLLPLLKDAGILREAFFQEAMVTVARSIFRHSAFYLAFKFPLDASEEIREKNNAEFAKFIRANGYVPVEAKHEHTDEVRMAMSKEKATRDENLRERVREGERKRHTKNKVCFYNDEHNHLHGIGCLKRDAAEECDSLRYNGWVTTSPNEVEIVSSVEIFEKHQGEAAAFQRLFFNLILFHLPDADAIVQEVVRTNFVVFLDKQGIKEGVIPVVFRQFPWIFKGLMPRNFDLYRCVARKEDEKNSIRNNGKNLKQLKEHEKLLKQLCLNENVANFIRLHSCTASQPDCNVVGVGIVKPQAYSWQPSNCNILHNFGSTLKALGDDVPFEMWSMDAVAHRIGRVWSIDFPSPCSKCKTFSSTMFHRSFLMDPPTHEDAFVTDFRCLYCVDTEHDDWQARVIQPEWAVVCRVEGSEDHVIFSNVKDSITFSSTRYTTLRSIRREKHVKTRKIEGFCSVSVDQRVAGDKEFSLDSFQTTLGDEFIREQFGLQGFPRIRSGVCTTWAKIRQDMACECQKKYKQFCLRRGVMPTKLKEPPMATFFCCDKASECAKIFSHIGEKEIEQFIALLNLCPPNFERYLTDDDRYKLFAPHLVRGEVLKLLLTLSSVPGKESCIEEAASWRNGHTKPTHCMFFGSEWLDYEAIRAICLQKIA